jgi:hypothetical protein
MGNITVYSSVLIGGHAIFQRGHRQNSKKWGAMDSVKWAMKISLLK